MKIDSWRNLLITYVEGVILVGLLAGFGIWKGSINFSLSEWDWNFLFNVVFVWFVCPLAGYLRKFSAEFELGLMGGLTLSIIFASSYKSDLAESFFISSVLGILGGIVFYFIFRSFHHSVLSQTGNDKKEK